MSSSMYFVILMDWKFYTGNIWGNYYKNEIVSSRNSYNTTEEYVNEYTFFINSCIHVYMNEYTYLYINNKIFVHECWHWCFQWVVIMKRETVVFTQEAQWEVTHTNISPCPLRSSRKWIFRCSECELIEKSDRSDWMGDEYSVMASKL